MKKISVVLLVFLIASCAGGWKDYPNDLDKNLTVSVEVRGTKMFSYKDFVLGIHKENPENPEDCKKDYLGSVDISSDTPAHIGLATGKRAYLRMVDDETQGLAPVFFTSGQTTKYMDFTFVPQKGYDYSVKYIVDKNRYGYEMTQTNRKTGRTSELEYDGWNAQCDN